MRAVSRKTTAVWIMALLMCGGGFLCPHEAGAEEGMVADTLLREARAFYEEGKNEKAIHNASKVLLLEPYNQEALDLLKMMGLQEGIYGAQPTTLNQIHALTEEIAGYQQELNALELHNQSQEQENQQLEDQKARLQEMISQKEQEKQRLIEQSRELRSVAVMKLQEKQDMIAELEDTSARTTEALVRLNTDMYQAKQQMVADKELIGEQAVELEAVQGEYDEHKKMSETELRELKRQYEEELLEIDKAKSELEHELFVVKDERQEKLKVLNEVLQQKDVDLAMEQDRLAVKSHELAQTQANLLRMKQELDQLRGQKDNLAREAEVLRQQIREVQREQTFRYAHQKKSGSKGSKEDMGSYIKKQDNLIAELKSRAVQALDEVKALKKNGNEADAERIAELEQEVEGLERRIREKQKDLTLYREQQDIFQQRIKDYQKRLKIVEGMIKDKEEQILFLEEQVGADVY